MRRFDIVMSEGTIQELERILRGFKIKLDEHDIQYQLQLIRENGVICAPIAHIDIVDDPNDKKFIETVTAAEASYLVIGYKALLRGSENYRAKKISGYPRFSTALSSSRRTLGRR